MEIFINIPFTKRKSDRSFLTIAVLDFKESLLFIRREKPIISKIIMILTLLNLFQTSLLLIATLMMFPISLMIYFNEYPLLSIWIMIPCCAVMEALLNNFPVIFMLFSL